MQPDRPVDRLGAEPALPTPAEWSGGQLPGAARATVVFLVILSIGLVVAAVVAFAGDDPAGGVISTVAALILGHVAGFGLWVWRTPRRSGRTGTLSATPDGATGVRFGYWFWTYYWFTGLLLIGVLALLALAVVGGASGAPAGGIIAIPAGIAALALGWVLVTVLRLAPGGITMSPAGVYHRSLTFTHFVPWEAVVAVDAGWLGTPVIVVKALPTPEMRVHRYTGRFGTAELRLIPYMAVRSYWLATDPATVYHALAFYQAYPRLRAELGTQSALDRIGGGNAVVPAAPGGISHPAP